MPPASKLSRLMILTGALFAFNSLPVLAQAPSGKAMDRSVVIAAEMNRLAQGGDVQAARRKAKEAEADFAAKGEAWLAASYAVAAGEYDMRMGETARLVAELHPHMDALLKVLDSDERSRGNTLVQLLMDAKGVQGDAKGQDELTALYEERIRRAHGENSPEDMDARVRTAFSLLESGRLEDGYSRLRAALKALAATPHHGLTLKHYADAARSFEAGGLKNHAAELFTEATQTQAINADVPELADFYLAYAQFRTETPDPQQHFVPLYAMATNLYARHYGNESAELIHANDKLATALSGIGQYGTSIDLETGNYETAVKALGPDNTITWRIANNLADMLRGLGSPSRALQYDLVVFKNREKYYGLNHFNTMVSANNVAQNYLDLGNTDEARRYFVLCLGMAKALGDRLNTAGMEGWIDYTDLLSGKTKFDEAAVTRLEGIVTNGEYPAILSMKAAHLLAKHFEARGDYDRSLKHLQQEYSISVDDMGYAHPLTFAARIAIANAKARTDTAVAASEFDSIDREMLRWVHLQVSVAGGRDVGDRVRAMADDLLYDYAKLALADASVVPAFADAVRRWPSLSTPDADNILKLAGIIDHSDEETARLLREIPRKSRITRETFAADVEQDLAYELLTQTKAMEQQLNERISARYHIDRETLLAKSLPTPADMLGDDHALVQYFITRKWAADRDGDEPLADSRLYATVWRKGKPPVLHDVGDPRDILSGEEIALMAQLQSLPEDGEHAKIARASKEAFADLHDSLIAPLGKDLDGAKSLLIIPDGQLFAVPFSLLSGKDGAFLEQQFTLRLLTEPDALYRIGQDQKLRQSGRVVLAGGIDYSKGKEAGATPLPGTLREVNTIAGLFEKMPDITIEKMTGAKVTETALKGRMEGAAIAHLATHGAYGSALNGGASNVDTLWQSEVILARSGDEHSMKRDGRDGRLYAFELMGWNLSGLDLLVLSACETGRGEETFVGGLRGLPTAASLAGAKRSLLTLWPVADEGTADFMVRYYSYLRDGETWSDALGKTRRDAISGKIPAAKDPLVWAAFVLFEN